METVKGPDSKEQRIEHMVTLYQLPLLRLCIMYLHDEEQAKDAVQETFILIWFCVAMSMAGNGASRACSMGYMRQIRAYFQAWLAVSMKKTVP